MTSVQKWIAGGIVAAILAAVAVLVGSAWLKEHDARLKAETVQQQNDARIQALQKQKDANTTQLAATVKQLEAQRSVAATPQQIVIDAAKLIPGLPQPLQATTAPAAADSKTSGAGASTEAAQAQGVLIPAADLQAVKDYSITCQENSAKLVACVNNAALSAEQYKDVTAERDQYKAAVKGGTIWQRLGKKAKCLALSGGLSAAGAWVDKDQPARGALIGASAGGVGCELF